jgi:hypothetical protein
MRALSPDPRRVAALLVGVLCGELDRLRTEAGLEKTDRVGQVRNFHRMVRFCT